MKNTPEKLCGRCWTRIRKYDSYMQFLLPKPNGEVRFVTMHGRCIELWNKIATTKAYSDAFYRAMQKAVI